jgi:transposase-like protein
LINQLRKRLIERAAGAELGQHLGYPPGGEPPEGQPNRRNGLSSKTLRTVDGPVTVELPRDRDASFEPRIVPSTPAPSMVSTSRSSPCTRAG